MIRFLIKSVFWLSLAFIVMPQVFPTGKENASSENAAPVDGMVKPDSIDQLLANGKTALELGKLCANNPAFCENGTSLLSGTASGMLQRSGSILEYLSDRFGTKPETPSSIIVKEEPTVEPSRKFPQTVPIPTPRASALRRLRSVAEK